MKARPWYLTSPVAWRAYCTICMAVVWRWHRHPERPFKGMKADLLILDDPPLPGEGGRDA